MRSVLSLLGVCAALAGCGSPELATGSADSPLPIVGELPRAATAQALGTTGTGLAIDRPYLFQVPSKYDKTKPTPLLIMLHGFTASGPLQEAYFNFRALAENKNILYAYPDGTRNPLGMRFWNAQEWCCDFFKSGVDDVAYIKAVIDDMASKYNVDPKRIYVTGHSNGGFMSHRLACELSDRIAGIVSLAGAQQKDPVTRCKPKEPVAIAEVHGDVDLVIGYPSNPNYPGARETVAIWAAKNGCSGRLTYDGTNMDLEGVLPGAETKIERYTGCPARGPVELWTIRGAGHVPAFNANYATALYNFLSSHPK